MNELILEIEEDIRRERFDALWAHFGRIMIAASAAVVMATVIFVIWQNHKQAEAQTRTALLIKGIDQMDAKNYPDAIAAFTALATDASSPYYGPAMLRKAQAQAASGDKPAAAKTYETLAHGGQPAFAGLAALLSGSPEAAKDSPFTLTQREQQGWEALRQGKKDEAVALFLGLYNGAETPYTMHERMQEILQHIAPEKLNQKG
jgi:hypothetical protein